MAERFILVKEALKERLRSGYVCDGCNEPISGRKQLVIQTGREVPPRISVAFICEPCQEIANGGGEFNA